VPTRPKFLPPVIRDAALQVGILLDNAVELTRELLQLQLLLAISMAHDRLQPLQVLACGLHPGIALGVDGVHLLPQVGQVLWCTDELQLLLQLLGAAVDRSDVVPDVLAEGHKLRGAEARGSAGGCKTHFGRGIRHGSIVPMGATASSSSPWVVQGL